MQWIIIIIFFVQIEHLALLGNTTVIACVCCFEKAYPVGVVVENHKVTVADVEA